MERTATQLAGLFDGATNRDLVTLALATVGALTGVGSLAWSIASHALTGDRVNVRLAYDSGTDLASPAGPPVAPPALLVIVNNAGRMPARLLRFDVQVHQPRMAAVRRHYTFVGPELPHRLDPGDDAMWGVPLSEFAAQFAALRGWRWRVKVSVVAHLGSGRIARSRPLVLSGFVLDHLKAQTEAFERKGRSFDVVAGDDPGQSSDP